MARIENWNPPTITNRNATYSWNVDYAALVHEGNYEAGYPARPWVDNAVSAIDFEADFAVKYRKSESLDAAFLHVVDVLSEQSLFELTNPVYDWPRNTQRRSGEFVRAGLRDIYDTGRLYSSQSVEVSS